MTRPHVEFMFAQALPWGTTVPLPQRESLECKILSSDLESGEASVVLRLPPGWSQSVTSGFQEELYVIDGVLQLDEMRLARDGYARIEPRRVTRWSAPQGAVVLVFSNADSAVTPATDPSGLCVLDTVTMPWDRSHVPEELQYMGIARKALFVDADSGRHRTWLLTTAPQSLPKGKQLERETHGCAEELYMLSGEITGPNGVMAEGAYFWRPAQTLHGPFGSRKGNLALCRFRDGEQTVTFHRQTLPFRFEAPYQPQLPAELEHLRARGGPYLGNY